MSVVKTIKRGELARHAYVPPEGASDEVLTKSSDDDADFEWKGVGRILWPTTDAENTAGVTPANFSYEPGHIKRYGAEVDGTTDDTAAIARAISQAVAGGADVQFPEGQTAANLNSAANVFTLSDGITLYGAGFDLSEVIASATPTSDRTLFFVTDEETATIRGLKITGPAADNGASNVCKGIRHGGTSGRLHVTDCWLDRWTDGIKKDDGDECGIYVDGCRFTNIRQQGILDVASSGRLVVTRCVFDTIGSTNQHHAIYHQAPFTELIVSHCTFRNCSGYGIHRFSTTGSGNGLVSIIGNVFAANTAGDVIIDDVSGAVDLSATLSGNSFGSATGVFVWAGNVTITGNTFRNSSKNIDTTGATTTGENVTVTGNTFRFLSLGIELTIAGNAGWTISGNTFIHGDSGTGDTAVRVDNGTDIKIDGNTFAMGGGQPLRCRTGSNRVYFTNNQVTGTTNGAGVYFQSTATDPGVFVCRGNQLAQTDRGVTCEVSGVTVEDNYIAASSPIGVSGGKTARIRYNQGYVTEASGTGSIASGATTATITHGLSVTPTIDDISITFGEQGLNDYGRFWIDTIGATTFRVNVSADPGANNLNFGWRAECL